MNYTPYRHPVLDKYLSIFEILLALFSHQQYRTVERMEMKSLARL